MTQTTRAAVVLTLALGLALSLAACGSETAANSAQITLRSSPPAEVWIGGEAKGTTPIEVTLVAGSHGVTFKAAGFTDIAETIAVEGGQDLTVSAQLRASTDTDAALTEVARALGIERSPYQEPEVHRGRSQSAVMLYWPQKDVRMEGLTSYRIDVTEDYEGDGFVEFRKGGKKGKVLHRDEFTPEQFATVRAIPESVREALKSGSTVTWGVFFESKRKKPITTKFKVTRKAKADKQLAGLEKRKFFRRQDPLVKALMRAEVLRNNRLYTESLVSALEVLQAYPDSIQPYRGIVQTAQRLGLKDTPLFATAARYVSGKGGRGRQGLNLAGAGADMGKGPQGTQLPPVFAAPSGSFVDRTPEEEPGVTVAPTEDTPADGTTPVDEPPVDATPTESAVAGLQQELEVLEQQIARAEGVERLMNEADANVEQADQAVRDRSQELSDAEAAREALPDGDPGIPEADRRVQEAQAAVDLADTAAREAAIERDRVREQAIEVLGQTGTAEEARRRAEELRREIELQQATQDGGIVDGVPTTPEGIARAAQTLQDAQTRQATATRVLNEAERALAEAQALPATDPSRDEQIDRATQERDAAQAELRDANNDLNTAQEQYPGELDPNAGIVPGRDERVDNAQQQVDQMRQNLDNWQTQRGAADGRVTEANAALAAANADLASANGLPATTPDEIAVRDEAIAAAQARVDHATEQLADAETRRDEAQTELDAAAEALKAGEAELEELKNAADK